MPRWVLFYLLFFGSFAIAQAPIPNPCRAILLATPNHWNDSHSVLQLYRRADAAAAWIASGSPKPVNLGKEGLAWGRGLHPPQSGPQKREGDKKSPAGIFLLGQVLYGYADTANIPNWRYRRVSDRDLWIEDPTSANYNRHLILLGHEPFPSNHLYDLMRQDDPAHALKLFIRHNAPPDVLSNAGSAIFFHLSRGADSVTTGCTSLQEKDFLPLLHSFDPRDNPVYVLLPKAEYDRLRTTWKLP